MRPVSSLRGLLCGTRPREPDPLGVVYRIPCADCSWSYVGESGRTLRERLTEHKRAVRGCSSSSEIARHVWEKGHQMDWEREVVLLRERNYYRRIFKEAWFSRAYESGNRTFHELDQAWFPLF